MSETSTSEEIHVVLPPRDIDTRLAVIESKIDALTEGVNLIGTMMNQVADVFDQTVQKLNQPGGLSGILGGLMGGKRND